MSIYVLDAWALLALLQKEEPAASRVRTLLQQAQQDKQPQLFLSVINLGEIFYILSRQVGDDEARQTIAAMQKLPLTILSATDERVLAAAAVKAHYPFSYADAFAVATAVELEATLVTGDAEIIQSPGGVQIEILVRS